MIKSILDSKEKLLLIIKLVIPIIGLSFLFFSIDLNVFEKIYNSFPIYALFIGLIFALVRTWLMMERWLLLSPKDTELNKWDYYKLMLSSGSINLFIPGILSADITRSILVSKKAKNSTSSAFLSVYFDRIIGFSSILILGIFSVFLSPQLYNSTSIIFFLVTILIFLYMVVWLSYHHKMHNILFRQLEKMGTIGSIIAKKISTISAALHQYKPSKKSIIYAFILCIPIHMIWFIMVWLIGNLIGVNISFFTVAVITTIVWVITVIPISMGGIGVREVSFVYLMSLQGVSEEQSMLMALFQSVIIILVGIIGLPFLLWRRS